jgi:hypothetical protein
MRLMALMFKKLSEKGGSRVARSEKNPARLAAW